jgi:hypothetical protein
MRRTLPAALICLLVTFPALARSGHGGGGGGGHAGGGRGGSSGRGGSFSGVRGGIGSRPGFRYGLGFYRYPGIYPFYGFGYYGGYYDPYWYSSPYDDSGYGPSYSYPSADYYPAAQAPPVIVNQEFQPGPPPQPMMREYTAPGPPAPAQPPSKYEEQVYLIAFHGGDIKAVLAYWVQGTLLHYVTMDHEQKQVTLTSVDRAMSERLNGERNVPFQLPR